MTPSKRPHLRVAKLHFGRIPSTFSSDANLALTIAAIIDLGNLLLINIKGERIIVRSYCKRIWCIKPLVDR